MRDPAAAVSLSVVIPARSAAKTLGRCVEAVRASEPGRRAEVVVVDDHSPEPLKRSSPLPGVRWVRHETCRGPAAARNTGARQARGEVVAFLDADVVVEADALQALLDPLLADRADVTHGVYRDSGEGPDVFARYKADWAGYKDHLRAGRAQAGYIESFAFACRREFFLASGGFSESLGPRDVVEDVEWSNRLRARGARIARVSAGRVRHLHRYTLRSFVTWQVLNASSVLRLKLALRGQPWQPRVGGIPQLRSLLLALSSVASVLLLLSATVAVGLAARGSPLLPLALGGCAAVLLLFSITQADFLWFALRRRSVAAALRDLALGFLTGLAFSAGLLHGALAHLKRPMRLPDPAPAAPRPEPAGDR